MRWICKLAAQHQVAVCNAVKYGTGSVVQHVWALILALTTKLADYRRVATDGTWQESRSFCLLDFPVEELEGKVLGIVGAGELGRGVAKVAEAFGLEVMYAALPGRQYVDQQRVGFSEFLGRADIVSLHCPLTADTTNLMGEAELALMKPSSILINTARGGMVNEAALVQALLEGSIAGAGIDVLTNEPPREGNVLLNDSIPNLIVTPHCAWVARQSRQRLVDQTVENLRAFMQGEPLPRAVCNATRLKQLLNLALKPSSSFLLNQNVFQLGILRNAIFIGWIILTLNQRLKILACFCGDAKAIFGDK